MPIDPTLREELRRHFEDSFRDLQLADIKKSVAGDVRMGTFSQCAAFLDALALSFRAPKNRDGAACWRQFVREYFPQPKYGCVADLYDGYRNKTLHNFSSENIAFVHDKSEAHLQRDNHGRLTLNREDFVADVESAFEKFWLDVQRDADLAMRVARHLSIRAPIQVQEVVIPTAAGVATSFGASVGGALSLSASPGKPF
jgi:hypothetical protein